MEMFTPTTSPFRTGHLTTSQLRQTQPEREHERFSPLSQHLSPFNRLPEASTSPLRSSETAVGSQQQYEEQLRLARSKYDERVERISAHVRQLFEDVQSDEAIGAMKGDPISAPYVNERIQELVEDSMLREKEMTIDHLSNELVTLKGELVRNQAERDQFANQIRKLENDLNHTKSQNEEERLRFSQTKVAMEESTRVKELQSQQEHNRVQELESQLQQKALEIDSLRVANSNDRSEIEGLTAKWRESAKKAESEAAAIHAQVQQIQEELEYCNRLRQKVQGENEALQLRFSNVEASHQDDLNREKKDAAEHMEALKDRFKAKSHLFKKKIQEQKFKLEHLSSELKASQGLLEASQHQQDARMQTFHKDLRSVQVEWEQKCEDLERSAAARESELASAHELQVSQLKSQYQGLLDQRVSELQAGMQSQLFQAKAAEEALLKESVQQAESLHRSEAHFEAELRRLRDELAESMDRTRGLDAEKGFLQSEISTMTRNFENQLADIKELMKSDNESKANEFDRERAALLRQIEEVTRKAEQTKAGLNDEVDKHQALDSAHRALQIEMDRAKASLQSREAEISDLKTRIRQMTNDHEDIVATLQRKIEKLEIAEADAQRMVGGLTEEQRRLEQTIGTLSEERRRLEVSSAAQVDDLTAQLRVARESLDTEARHHSDTRITLASAESRVGELEAELQALRSRYDTLETEADGLRTKLTSATTETEATSTQLTNTTVKLTDLCAEHNRLQARTKTLLRTRIGSLRGNLAGLQTEFKSELEGVRKACQGVVQDVMFQFIDNVNSVRADGELAVQSTVAEWKARLAKAEGEAAAHLDTIRLLERQLDTTKSSVDSLQQERSGQNREIDSLHAQLLDLRTTLHATEADNATLRNQIHQNASAFDQLQSDVTQEAVRIKQEQSQSIEQAKLTVERRYQGELERLQGDIERLKSEHSDRLAYFAGEVESVQRAYHTDLLRQSEAARSVTLELEMEKQRSARLKDGLMQLDAQTSSLQTEQSTALRTYEQKLDQLQNSMTVEKDKNRQTQKEKDLRIESLANELTAKTELVREMNMELSRRSPVKSTGRLTNVTETVQSARTSTVHRLGEGSVGREADYRLNSVRSPQEESGRYPLRFGK